LRALLSSSRAKEARIDYTSETAVKVVQTLRSMGRPVVFDLGSGFSPMIQRLQQEMDHLVLVVDPVNVTLTMARELLQEIETTRAAATSMHIVVVNRAASSSPPPWHEVEQILGHEIRAIISLASELVNQAVQANVPVVMFQPTAIASSQIIKLAEDLTARIRMLSGGEVSA
jgi:Flp pilus assembly CpaE family ATPase